jgi:hypothetical protein
LVAQTSGYSRTPLSKKLGITEGAHIALRGAPNEYGALFESLPPGLIFDKRVSHRTDMAHVFCDQKVKLKSQLGVLRASMRSDAVVWVSWPKKASKVASDITEDTIREVALPLGFVDVKVCSVSAVWSGLKLVIRKELR